MRRFEEQVVLDVGSCIVRCGFAGEPQPRHVLPIPPLRKALFSLQQTFESLSNPMRGLIELSLISYDYYFSYFNYFS